MSVRIFSVAMTVTALVQADSAEKAMSVSKDSLREIAGDVLRRDIAVGVIAEITSLAGLPDGWDGRCLPYGGDGNTRLSQMLPERAV